MFKNIFNISNLEIKQLKSELASAHLTLLKLTEEYLNKDSMIEKLINILNLTEKYLVLKIEGLENSKKNREETKNILQNLIDKYGGAEAFVDLLFGKSYSENSSEKESESELKNRIEKEVRENLEKNPIPYLIEMLNTNICNTMEDEYSDRKFNSKHPIQWSPHFYSLDKDNLGFDVIKLLQCKDKVEIIKLIKNIFSDSEKFDKVRKFYSMLQTKSSNAIITMLVNKISDEISSNRS